MAGQPKSRRRKSRAEHFFNLPDGMDMICARVREGTLLDFCKEFDLHYGMVQAWIESDEERRRRYAEACAVRDKHGRDLVLREIYDRIQTNYAEAFDEQFNLKSLDEIPPDLQRLIMGVDVTEGKYGRSVKVRFADKDRALELLARHHKMLTDKHEIEAGQSIGDILAASFSQEPKK